MKHNDILNNNVQEFIFEKTGKEISKLALQKNPFPHIDYKEILNQIEARTKSKSKLPSWFNSKNIIYPSKISIEQTSSEITARYKSTLVFGENLIDLTGGFGVDDYYFSKSVKTVIHCEINPELSSIVKSNFQTLNIDNIQCITGDCFDVLKELKQQFSWIYIDPSRRNDAKGKVFMLNDCLPNVPDNLEFYFNFSDNILIKTAPILDITAGLLELKNVKKIHIVAIENEVKELLWEIEKNYKAELKIVTINLTKNNNQVVEFNSENKSNCNYSLPLKYLYEPNASIMKSACYNELGNQFSLSKLHQHSHLYTSNNLIEFPGRVFEIEKTIDYSKNNMKSNFENTKSNITIRNFPETVENIRKKWKIKDGGINYSFFTTDINNNKIALICTKIN